MKIGSIIAGVLVCICVALVFGFTLMNLIKGVDKDNKETAVETVSEETAPSAAAPAPEPLPSVSKDQAKAVSEDKAPTEEAKEEEKEEEITFLGFDPDKPYIDTFGEDIKPEKAEDYEIESTNDLKQFWNNGKRNYVSFRNFIIKKTYKNTQDMVCDYFIDLSFRDGSSLQGIRCNDVTELTEGRRFKYGYVMDDSTQENDQNVMYLYIVQE